LIGGKLVADKRTAINGKDGSTKIVYGRKRIAGIEVEFVAAVVVVRVASAALEITRRIDKCVVVESGAVHWAPTAAAEQVPPSAAARIPRTRRQHPAVPGVDRLLEHHGAAMRQRLCAISKALRNRLNRGGRDRPERIAVKLRYCLSEH
jgi:hypothetical protein